MFTNQARILVCILLGLAALLAAYFRVYEIAAFGVLLIGLVIWGYFKEGTVILAAKQYKNKQYEKAKELLLSIKNPEYLNKRRRPYYELILGNIAVQYMNYEEAEYHLGQAAVRGLRASDLGTAIMHLANISLRKKDKEKGLIWIAQAKKIPLPARQQSILENLEKELHKIK
jgi:hypothetical protein